MKKSIKLLAGAILLGASVANIVFAQEIAEPEEVKPYYITYTGIVNGVEEDTAGRKIVTLGEDATTAAFVFNDLTYIANAEDVKVGDEITGYYKANAPMILIYPPQYTPEVVVVTTDEVESYHVDFFNEELESSDGYMKLAPDAVENVKYQNGLDFYGELKNMRLVVKYPAVSMSIPAYPLTPEIVVLLGKVEEEVQIMPTDIGDLNIVVNGETVDGARVIEGENELMLPLRSIAEGLGYEVVWEDDTRTIFLDYKISIKVDDDYYTYLRTAPISLGTAPKLVDDSTFVPFSFFEKVARVSQIEINGDEVVING